MDINGKSLRTNKIQGISKRVKKVNGTFIKDKDAKWFQFWKGEWYYETKYCIDFLYGTNKLKWIEGSWEHDMSHGDYYVEGYHERDIDTITFKFNTLESRDSKYDEILSELNLEDDFKGEINMNVI